MSSDRSSADDSRSAARTVLTNVRVFDGHALLDPGTVVIDGALVGTTADSGNVRHVDGHGGVLLPGLIDAHVHLSDVPALHAFAAHGITTALDMGTWPASLVVSLRGRPGLTDIRSSTVGATSPDSAHAQRTGRPSGGLVSGPEDAKQFVAQRLAEGADYIKIIIDLPGFD
ncbi:MULTISPECIES: hypothetical protein [unclassified Streptomyces]|uniref:hypothetical protein n=1 Tax=unclassified Streptomyces TaxID=2593676 RepID=UPI0035DFAE92